MKIRAANFIALLLFIWSACEAYTPTPTMHVTTLVPANEPFFQAAGASGFFFYTDTNVDFDPAAFPCLVNHTTNLFGIPKANPSPTGGGDNPAYRDHVNAVMLAFTLNKPIVVGVEGCISGVPRVVVMFISE